ncbi:hypothetical protein CKO11_13210 [Rhodobacter sp. TJ_12]|nr:hypothetical protein [Rhodobacter sp. TJ_12]
MGGPNDGSGGGAPPMQRWVQWAGAASSVALVIGVVIWGYKLAVRDVSGVPIIRAMEGPARVAPENPGGDLAAHVGLAVNEVAGSGLAAPGPDRVVLAPEPTDLAPDDAPMAALRPLPEIAPPEEAATPEVEAEGEDIAALPVPDRARPTPEGAPTPDRADAPEPGIEAAVAAAMQDILEEEPAEAVAPEEEAAVPPEDIISPDVPGLARSPRPVPRPARDLQAEAAAAARAQADGAEVEELDPAEVPAGTRVVQLGAFDSPEIARAEWDRAMRRFDALMIGKRRIVQEAISGGRSFWRLRVEGFANVDEARQFCAALVAEGANCIPTVMK